MCNLLCVCEGDFTMGLVFSDWNDLFTTKCFACGFPVEAGDRWVEALNNNYHSQCFNCTVRMMRLLLKYTYTHTQFNYCLPINIFLNT